MDYAWIETPVGRLLLISGENGLHRIDFANGSSRPDPAWHESPDALKETIRQLRAYFARELEEFDVRLAPEGTPFQKNVWRHLCEIPYGDGGGLSVKETLLALEAQGRARQLLRHAPSGRRASANW